MNLRCHSAVVTTGSCIKRATKSPGGKTYGSMRLGLRRAFGDRVIQRRLTHRLNQCLPKQRPRTNGHGNKFLPINKMLSTAPGLEPNPVNDARGQMRTAMDSRQKRSLMLRRRPESVKEPC